ncbi:Uncharacterised protein [Staphylococcus aureus]|nr:Uncharacterised protein [Staphylococcus aureus]
MVTSEPKLANAVPNSDPMYPPPTTTNLPGTSCKFKAPVESITRLPNLKLGISIGLEPVAMIAFLKLYVCALFSSITRKLLLSTKYASPLTMLTLLPLSKPSTPPVNLLTTDDLNS